MHIKKLEVKNFRNHKSTIVNFSQGTNILVGDNAQGKTNLLEAVCLTCVGRGWRTRKDKEMINFESDLASVKTITAKKFGNIEIEVGISKQSKKTIQINKIPIQKMGELMGQINCVFFSPDELRLIKDAPSDRRRFLDIDISQLDKVYFYNLLRYHKVLAQRNALLKSAATEDIESGLDIWDRELAKTGTYIIKKRIEFLDLLRPLTEKVHSFLVSGKETISLVYEKNIDIIITHNVKDSVNETNDILNLSINNAESIFLDALKKSRTKDMKLRTTNIGPHRDDIYISINDKDVRTFASQGQQRTVALSLKLAELELFKNLTNETPVLLLDDVLSELDESRQSRLFQAIKDCQSIITTTALPENIIDINIINVYKGQILE
ncbi:MAG: DNA replication/repair protein RecF [Firmicutes bacterium]|nr:DNA replication/repair protein RecF [Bacillota bacterium]